MKRLRPIPATTAPAISGLLAGFLLVLALITASRSAHDVLHECAHSTAGDCAVCLLLAGQVAVADTAVAAVCTPPAIQHAPVLPGVRLGAYGLWLPPGRGPPAPLVSC